MSTILGPEPSPALIASRSVWRRLPRLWLAWMVLLAGLLTTGLLWRDVTQREDAAVAARFEYRTERIRGELVHHLEEYETALKSVAGFIGSRNQFDRSRWRRYFEKSGTLEHYPGRLILGYAPRLNWADRATHEATTRGEGLADYSVTSSGGAARGEFLPLAFVRRYAKTSPVALGTDLADDPLILEAMSRAARNAHSVMVGPLAWSPSAREEDQIWGLVVPVFGGAAVPTGAAERQASVVGFLIEGFNSMDSVGSTLGPDARMIGLKVHDGQAPLFTCPEMKKELAAGFRPTLTRRSDLNFGERTWTLEFVALPDFLAANASTQPRGVLFSGLLVSLLLAGLVGTMALQHRRARSMVSQRTMALRDALARSEASEAQTRAVVDNALDAIITIDESGAIQSFNPAAERLFGHTEAQVLTRNVSVLMPSPYREQHDQYLESYRRTGEARIIGIGRELTGLRHDGSTFPLELGVSVMHIGTRRMFCGIVRDITQRRAAEQALLHERATLEQRVVERTEVLTRTNGALAQEIDERRRIEGELVAAREQALQAADAKAGFLANMSHEIRTPMNAVVGMTALLEETPLNGEQRDYVETIRTSGDALLAVINDILDFSKVESGMLELEHRPFELGACIEEAVDMLAPRAAEKGIDLLYVLADDVPPWIAGDALRLRQVFVNLLSNAVKFTERGEVCLSAALVARQGDRVSLQFSVRDTGIGLGAAQRRHLFRAFTQADSSTTRKYGGTGLGLAICQRLTQLMGGVIGVESEEGQGSTFIFTIVAEAAVAPAQPGRYVSDTVPELSGKRVLLVDDNATNLRILETLCRRWGMAVVAAGNGPEALAVLDRDRQFDVAVLDLHMPGMDGVQLAQQVRWLCPGNQPALVLLSSSAQRRGGVDALFAAHLAKPVKHSHLFDTLSRVLHGGERSQAPTASSRRLDPSLAQRLPLKILVAEDSAINQKLAVGILAKLGYASDVAANGVEAVALARAGHYDLIFMDLQMPEMDGIAATRRILTELPAGEQPRIVAMTANALAGDRERCLAAGMHDYIAKPILPVDVQALIERLARGAAPLPAPSDPDSVPLIDQRVVDELRAIDEPGTPSLLRDLLHDYLAETPRAVSEIKRDADRREVSPLAAHAHRLAGVSASIGAAGMAEICVRIERHIAAGDLTGLMPLIDQLELRFARTRAELQRLV